MPDAESGVEAAREVGDQRHQGQQAEQNQPGRSEAASGLGGGEQPGLQAERDQQGEIGIDRPDAERRQAGEQHGGGAAVAADREGVAAAAA